MVPAETETITLAAVPETIAVECHRCCGLMVRTCLTDSLGEAHEMKCWGWRCVLCGEIIDRQILHNRARQSLPIACDCWPMAEPSEGSEFTEVPTYQGDIRP